MGLIVGLFVMLGKNAGTVFKLSLILCSSAAYTIKQQVIIINNASIRFALFKNIADVKNSGSFENRVGNDAY